LTSDSRDAKDGLPHYRSQATVVFKTESGKLVSCHRLDTFIPAATHGCYVDDLKSSDMLTVWHKDGVVYQVEKNGDLIMKFSNPYIGMLIWGLFGIIMMLIGPFVPFL